MSPGDFALFVLMMTTVVPAGLTLVLRGPLGKAISRRLEGGSAASPELEAQVRELEDRLQQLEADRGRVAELEERLDFAERLLGRSAPAARELPGARG